MSPGMFYKVHEDLDMEYQWCLQQRRRTRSPHQGNRSGCCVLTETWIRRGQKIPCTGPVEQIAEAEKPGRPAGGAAMLVKPGIRFQLIRKIYNRSAFAVWIRLQGNVDVIGTYLRPGAPPEHVDSLLHEIQARARHPTIVTGDLNARHRG